MAWPKRARRSWRALRAACAHPPVAQHAHWISGAAPEGRPLPAPLALSFGGAGRPRALLFAFAAARRVACLLGICRASTCAGRSGRLIANAFEKTRPVASGCSAQFVTIAESAAHEGWPQCDSCLAGAWHLFAFRPGLCGGPPAAPSPAPPRPKILDLRSEVCAEVKSVRPGLLLDFDPDLAHLSLSSSST